MPSRLRHGCATIIGRPAPTATIAATYPTPSLLSCSLPPSLTSPPLAPPAGCRSTTWTPPPTAKPPQRPPIHTCGRGRRRIFHAGACGGGDGWGLYSLLRFLGAMEVPRGWKWHGSRVGHDWKIKARRDRGFGKKA